MNFLTIIRQLSETISHLTDYGQTWRQEYDRMFDAKEAVKRTYEKKIDLILNQDSPEYNPAEHWGEDYTVIEPGESFCLTCGGSGCQGFDPVYPCDDCLGYGWIDYKRDPPECRHCGGLGYFPAHTYCLPENAEPAYSCDECDGWGYLWEFEPPPELEEIDYELMGVPL